MKKKTLCRISVGGKIIHLVAVFREGSKVAECYRLMNGRKRLVLCDYPAIDYALRAIHNGIDGEVLDILKGGLS